MEAAAPRNAGLVELVHKDNGADVIRRLVGACGAEHAGIIAATLLKLTDSDLCWLLRAVSEKLAS